MEIKQLSSDVVDKIAAGEVVERPAHLLKELIENSLDAGATSIEIEINEGGRNILISDNGKGVLPEDLKFVVARHATSKISESDDLWRLSTFGFRGEALASIASVSRMDFISKRKDASTAYQLHSEFGVLSEVQEVSAAEGTTVRVQDLFANIPARLKFLKSDAAEVAQIKTVVKAMALQFPHCIWRLKVKNELVYLWNRIEDFQERAQKVLEVEKLYQTTHAFDDFQVQALFSDPSQVGKTSKNIWIFVQNRWVQDRGLQAAVMEAYRSLLMHGQYPVCVISLNCPPDQVDVNIHPTKSQVKFLDSQKAFRAVYHTLRSSIETAPWLQPKSPINKSFQTSMNSVSQLDALDAIPKTPYIESSRTERNLSFTDHSLQRTQFSQKSYPLLGKDHTLSDFPTMAELRQRNSERAESLQKLEETSYWGQLQVIGQVDLTYIVAQSADRMLLIDQHAAHERVAFERLMKAWKAQSFEVQSFLFPLTVDLEEYEVESLLNLTTDLSKMGIQMEQAGPSSLALNSHPAFISEKGLVEALKKLAREIHDRGGSFALEQVVTDLFATMACHSVVRAGQSLSLPEMRQLLIDMDEFPLSGFCPHGRSVSLEFPFVQLEKDFGRRV